MLPTFATLRKLDILRVDKRRVRIRRDYLLTYGLGAKAYEPELARHSVHHLVEGVYATERVGDAILLYAATHGAPLVATLEDAHRVVQDDGISEG